MQESILQDIGLSHAEIKAYLSLLEIGPTTSGPIITHTKMQSSVVHRVLKTLIQKGVITYIKVGKNKEYQATNPENLLEFIEEKKYRLKTILPQLENLQQRSQSPHHTEMFSGKRAMFSALTNLIREADAGKQYLSFSLIEPHGDEEIISFYHAHNLQRFEKQLEVKVLVNETVRPIYENNYPKKLLKRANVRYTHFHFPQGIVIFQHAVTFVHWATNPFAVKITSKEMAQQFKEFFLEFYEQESNAY